MGAPLMNTETIVAMAISLFSGIAFTQPLPQDPSCPSEDSILKKAKEPSADTKDRLRNLPCMRRIDNQKAIPGLLALTAEKDERLASAAAEAITRSLHDHIKDSRQPIQRLLKNQHASVRNEALRFIGESAWDASSRSPIIEIMRGDKEEANRIAAIYALARWKQERKEIEGASHDESESVRGAAAFALKNFDSN